MFFLSHEEKHYGEDVWVDFERACEPSQCLKPGEAPVQVCTRIGSQKAELTDMRCCMCVQWNHNHKRGIEKVTTQS